MSELIGLQAGHQNIQRNSDPTLASETGASGEEELNVAVRDTLSPILQAYGFQVQLDDANANEQETTTGKDFAFYLALHAEGAPAGGNIVAPDPSVDQANTDSRRIVEALKSVYFSDTGIVDNGIETGNETFYYMWNALSAATPCGIIEMGDLQDTHDSVILADHRRIALALAHGFCVAFGKEWKGYPLTESQTGEINASDRMPEPTTSPDAPQGPSTEQQVQKPVEIDPIVPPTPPANLPEEHKAFYQAFITWVENLFQKKNE
jgi:hypothetical protein